MASRLAGGLLLLCLYLGVTVSVPSSNLVKSWGGECDGHTCVNSAWVVGLGHSIGCY